MRKIRLNPEYGKEWQKSGMYFNPLFPDISPIRNFPISTKENFLRLLRGEKPVYLPVLIDMLPLAPRLIPDNVVRAFSFDYEPIQFGAPQQGGPDMFGVQWDFIPVTGGSMVRPLNPKIKDINHWEKVITFPDLDQYDWAGEGEKCASVMSGDRLNRVWILTGLNERLISFMDFDKTMIAYVDEQMKEGVHRLFDRLCVFYDDLIDRFKTYFNCDILMFNDDWGTQRGPQFSPDTAREMLAPYIRRIAESCHKRGIYLELHSCGKNDMLAPVIAESNVDIWQPQEAINDFELIYSTIGDKVCLSIPSGTTSDMSDEICFAHAEEFMDKYGKYGNVILNITPLTPYHPRVSEFLYHLSREAYAQFM
ncbi:MAG: hypothetical protein GX111_05165 [Clostridiales bacterium]|nr:hypothetical protein [Clostridiales bacterium]